MKNLSLDKDKIRILLLEGIHPNAIEHFKQQGYSNIESITGSLNGDTLIDKAKNAHIIGIRSRTQLNNDVLKSANKLLAIGCFCIGSNQVSLDVAQDLGVPVFNAPFSNTRSVAELVLAQMIMLLRGIPEKNALAHRGIWQKSATNSYELRGKTLGIVGYGHIGTQLSILAEGLGMQVCFFDVDSKLALGNAQSKSSLNALLNCSDVVSFHVPETLETRLMMGSAQFQAMKNKAILINASRGSVVDIDALTFALKNKKILGAAVDVFPLEPKSNQDEFISALREFDNVILTPHIGGSTFEAQQNIGLEVAQKLVKYSDNGSTLSALNFPQVALPDNVNKSRLLHIHTNEPGVLAKIVAIFSSLGINISAQYLQTLDRIGYVVMDIETSDSAVALARLKEIPGTIRSRLLH